MSNDNLNAQKKDTNPKVHILSQFLKDLSFECPESNIGIDEKDMFINVEVGLAKNEISDEEYEITLKLDAKAEVAGKTLFLADVKYAGRFIIQNIPEDQKEMILFIEAPSMLYPFARRILMNAIIDAGFRSPQIDPINFAYIYMQNKKQQQAKNVMN